MRSFSKAPLLSLMLVCSFGSGGLLVSAADRPAQALDDPNFFPIAVWLQSPSNAERYRAAGINTYIGLWKGPTDEQLSTLKRAGMRLVCSQNKTALSYSEPSMIIAWMHGDEPDNAQSLGEGKGWGPPIPPEKIVADYKRLRATDPTRPVVLNLGQAVAWDGWHGRGVRSRHPEDYPLYLEGCDIASFDIYPAVHDHPDVAGKLWYVAQGVQRLVQWSEGKKRVWNCLECTRISNPDRKPTPLEVRCEAYMSIIHGSRGLIYFVHQFKPSFREAALLDDEPMLKAVTDLNHQLTGLAAVINSPTITGELTILSSKSDVPLAAMHKRLGSTNYLFTVCMRNADATATLQFKDAAPKTLEVVDEQRTLSVSGKTAQDQFAPWQPRLYRWLQAK